MRLLDQGPFGDERRAFVRGDAYPQRLAVDRGRRLDIRTGGLVDVGVVGAPDQVAGADAGEVDGAVGEVNSNASRRDLVRPLSVPGCASFW